MVGAIPWAGIRCRWRELKSSCRKREDGLVASPQASDRVCDREIGGDVEGA